MTRSNSPVAVPSLKRPRRGRCCPTRPRRSLSPRPVWTLTSFFQIPKDQIIEKVSIIIGSEAVQISDKDLLAEALVLYARKNIDFIDAYHAVLMKKLHLPEIYSYDRDFDRIAGLKRLEP